MLMVTGKKRLQCIRVSFYINFPGSKNPGKKFLPSGNFKEWRKKNFVAVSIFQCMANIAYINMISVLNSTGCITKIFISLSLPSKNTDVILSRHLFKLQFHQFFHMTFSTIFRVDNHNSKKICQQCLSRCMDSLGKNSIFRHQFSGLRFCYFCNTVRMITFIVNFW